MKWAREQYIDLMTHNHPERPMFSELFGPIVGLDAQWRAQGAEEDMISLERFSFDYVPYTNLGEFGPIGCPKPVVLQEDAVSYVGIDHLGRRVRLDKRTATIPLPETYPVETMDDWMKIKKWFLYDDSRVTPEELSHARQQQAEGTLIKVNLLGAFDILRELMGEVNCCIAYYEDPELINDILDTISATNARLLERICREVTVDALFIHEDMAGKTGPMIGPNLVREFMVPYYQNAWQILQASGTKLFCQDSDGDINVDIDAFIEGGVNVFLPCEPAANMDIVALRKKYGNRIAFHGGIDKHVLRKSKEEIKAELDYKLQPCMLEGGVVFGLDHRITNGTPLENYIYYVDYARQKLGLEDFRTAEPCWGRMGF